MAHKLTVEFGDLMADKLQNLADRKGVSKIDVLRRALTLYDYAEKQLSADPEKNLSITLGDKKLHDIILS